MYTEIDLKLLQPLLLRTKVVNIRIRQIVSLTEQCAVICLLVVDNLLTQQKQFLEGVTEITSVQNMVVVSTIVEAHKFLLEQRFYVQHAWIDHADDLIRVLNLPTHDEEIRIYLHIEED